MDSQQPWINCGYDLFAREGPEGLKVERLARLVSKSKSSFYHHFADLEVFTELLLQTHLERSERLVERERQCAQLVPDLLLVLVEAKTDLLFNRQLRVHRDRADFRQCFERSSRDVGEAMGTIWAEALSLEENSPLAQVVLNLVLENFYLQLTEENLHYDWLLTYVKGLQAMVSSLKHEGRRMDLAN